MCGIGAEMASLRLPPRIRQQPQPQASDPVSSCLSIPSLLSPPSSDENRCTVSWTAAYRSPLPDHIDSYPSRPVFIFIISGYNLNYNLWCNLHTTNQNISRVTLFFCKIHSNYYKDSRQSWNMKKRCDAEGRLFVQTSFRLHKALLVLALTVDPAGVMFTCLLNYISYCISDVPKANLQYLKRTTLLHDSQQRDF